MVVGSVDNEDVRRVLTYVVANGERFDPGTRLDCLDALKARSDDEQVRKALVKAARTDKNAAVRLKALDALRDSTQEDAVRETLLEALRHDANPGVRVEAVNLLVRSLSGDADAVGAGSGAASAVAEAGAIRRLRLAARRLRRTRTRSWPELAAPMMSRWGAWCGRWRICSGAIRTDMCGCGARRRCGRSAREICSRRAGQARTANCGSDGNSSLRNRMKFQSTSTERSGFALGMMPKTALMVFCAAAFLALPPRPARATTSGRARSSRRADETRRTGWRSCQRRSHRDDSHQRRTDAAAHHRSRHGENFDAASGRCAGGPLYGAYRDRRARDRWPIVCSTGTR